MNEIFNMCPKSNQILYCQLAGRGVKRTNAGRRKVIM